MEYLRSDDSVVDFLWQQARYVLPPQVNRGAEERHSTLIYELTNQWCLYTFHICKDESADNENRTVVVNEQNSAVQGLVRIFLI